MEPVYSMYIGEEIDVGVEIERDEVKERVQTLITVPAALFVYLKY